MKKPRTFKDFPPDIKCPVCGTSNKGRCVLIPIDGTGDGRIAEAAPTHLWCAIATQFNKSVKVIYTRTK